MSELILLHYKNFFMSIGIDMDCLKEQDLLLLDTVSINGEAFYILTKNFAYKAGIQKKLLDLIVYDRQSMDTYDEYPEPIEELTYTVNRDGTLTTAPWY